MAVELTTLVHGQEEAQRLSRPLCTVQKEQMMLICPLQIDSSLLTDDAINIMDLIVECSIVPSKSEARRLIKRKEAFLLRCKVESFDFSIQKLS